MGGRTASVGRELLMARLSSTFALTDVSAMFSRQDSDGRHRLRPMRMLVSIPDDATWDDRGRSCDPSPREPGGLQVAWVTALLARSSLPSAPAIPPCPIDERELIET